MDEITAAPVRGHSAHGAPSIEPAQPGRDIGDAITSQLSNTGDSALDFHDENPVSDSAFAFSPSQLHKLLTTRSLPALRAIGGLRGLAAGLRTDTSAGLSVDETTLDGTVSFAEAVAAGREHRPARIVAARQSHPPTHHGLHIGEPPDEYYVDRKRVFGENSLPRRKQKSFFRLMWLAFNDKLIILLTISATISLAIGIYQSVDPSISASRMEWVDGVTIVTAIVIIVLASAAMDWQKNQKFKKLNERKEQRAVTVIRSGKTKHISVYDVLVGDVMHVEAGEVIAVDGVLIQASSLKVDESSVSGEADLVHKTVPTENDPFHTVHADPFILSGTTVASGVGRYLVTSVGVNSTYGRMLLSLRSDVEETPLQAKLGRLGKQLIIFGAVAGSLFFLILLIRFLAELKYMTTGPSQKAEAFLHVLTIAVTLVVITVPEGLALNVTIALAFATKRMLRDNNLVRLLRSCEIMGNATSVCSDKTGTLTQNRMSVVTGRIGLEGSFDDTELAFTDPEASMSRASTIQCNTSAQLVETLSRDVKKLVKDSMALNSTAFESDNSGTSEFVGSRTETALLEFSRQHLGMSILDEERHNMPAVAMLPFDSSRKWMAVLVKLPNRKYRLLVKGAAEVIFEYCAYLVSDPTYGITVARISDSDRTGFHNTIQDYATKMLRPVAIAYRDFNEADVLENPDDELSFVNLEWLASGMVFIGVFGICDPLRAGVVESVRQCQSAGVFVRMVTGDNFLTAKAIATECGIYTAGGIAMDGPTFRDLTPEQQEAVIPRLQVLARSSPEDKLLLVSHLKRMNETVAVTGDGTNDALALKAADVGFAMGIQGTEVAKEAASIILLDDNFASIVKAIGWGRTVNDAVKKFCQFQFTINITAGAITVVSELVGDAIFTIVQLLWINLIMDILASLAFATDSPSPEFLKRKPEPRNASIVTITMWKMIVGQTIYQLLVVFIVHYAGWDLFNPDTEFEIEKLQTLVFNIYVWMQFFNQHNCKRVDNKLDIWYQGVFHNPWFIGIQLLTIVGQFIIVFKGGEAFDTEPITGAQWGWSLLFGIATIPCGALIRRFPDRWVLQFFQALHRWYLVCTRPFRACIFRLKTRGRRSEHPPTEQRELGELESVQSASRSSQGGVETNASATQGDTAVGSMSPGLTSNGSGPRRYIDLQGLVDAAKLGREVTGVMFEVHPRTCKDDPILTYRSNTELPPSQDPEVMKHIKIKTERQVRRAPGRVLPMPGQIFQPRQPRQPQPRQQHSQQPPRTGFRVAEWLLRTKRR